MKCTTVVLAALGLLVGSAGSVKASILYTQPPTLNGGDFFSQNDTGGTGNYATVYDNFTLGTMATVTNVAWTGDYMNPAGQGTITAFTLTFWSDNAGQPGLPLASESISGNANETFIGAFGGTLAYGYNANLPSSFADAAGTQYWLSIVADLPLPFQWGWDVGTGGDSIAYDDFPGPPFFGRVPLFVDFAFTLNGQADAVVPEPATLTMLGFGVAGLLSYGWRRRKDSAKE